jgi:hypothetical protein
MKMKMKEGFVNVKVNGGGLIVYVYGWPPKTYPRPSSPPRPAGMVIRLRGGNSRLRKAS